jgi:iron complex transport system ATP-binding protein
MTTHQPVHALTHARRALLLKNGRVVADGAPGEVMTSLRLTELYGTPIRVADVSDPGSDSGTQRVCFPGSAAAPDDPSYER